MRSVTLISTEAHSNQGVLAKENAESDSMMRGRSGLCASNEGAPKLNWRSDPLLAQHIIGTVTKSQVAGCWLLMLVASEM